MGPKSFNDIAVGTTTTSGTTDYLVDGALTFYADARSELENGEEYTALIQHDDFSTAGYELVSGVITKGSPEAGSFTFARTTVHKSTSGVGTKYNWPDTATKRISIVARGDQLSQWALSCVDLPPGRGVFVAGTGQSNNAWASIMLSGTAPEVVGRVYDWSTAGVAPYSRSNLEWREVDPTRQTRDVESPYVGYGRTVMVGSPEVEVPTGQITYGCASAIASFTGRDVYMLNVGSPGAAIDNTNYGWVYDPGSGNSADVLAEEIGNAITALATARSSSPQTLPASAEGITYPHVLIWAQGEADAFVYKDSGLYASQLSDVIEDMYRTDRYGYLDEENSVVLICQLGPDIRDNYPDFVGLEITDEITDHRVKFISRMRESVYDGIHISGETAMAIGKKCALALFSSQFTPDSKPGPWKSKRVTTDVPTTFYFYAGDMVITGSPQSTELDNGYFGHNAAEDEFYLCKIDGNPLGTQDWSDIGLHRLGEFYTTLVFANSESPDTTLSVIVTSPPADMGTFWKWENAAIVHDSPRLIEHPNSPFPGYYYLKSVSSPLWDGEEMTAFTGLPISSSSLADGATAGPGDANEWDAARLTVDTSGKITRLQGGGEGYITATTDGPGTHVIDTPQPPDGRTIHATVEFVGKNTTVSPVETCRGELKFAFRRTGAVTTVLYYSESTMTFCPTNGASPEVNIFDFSCTVGLWGVLNINIIQIASGRSPEDVWQWSIIPKYIEAADV